MELFKEREIMLVAIRRLRHDETEKSIEFDRSTRFVSRDGRDGFG